MINKQYRSIYITTALLSIIFVAAVQFFNPIVSPDSVLYVLLAKQYQAQGFHAALKSYGWPFYSILLSYVHVFSGLSYIAAARFLNYIFFLIFAFSFLAVVRELGGDQTVLWCAVIVIFASHEVIRLYFDAIRDTGYLAFYTLSIYAALRYVRLNNWASLLLWLFVTAVSTLFRVEGIFILFLLPMFFVFYPRKRPQRILCVLRSYILYSIVFVLLLLVAHYLRYVIRLGRLGTIESVVYDLFCHYQYFIHPHLANINPVFDIQFKPQWSNVLLFGFTGTYFWMLLNQIGFGVCIAVISYWVLKARRCFGECIVWGYVCITFLVTFLFLFESFFIVKRYLADLGIALSIFAPFGLRYIYDQWTQKIKQWRYVFIVVVILLLVNIVGSLTHFGPSKRYLKNAADWINANTKTDAIIQTKEPRFSLYIHRTVIGWQCKVGVLALFFPDQCQQKITSPTPSYLLTKNKRISPSGVLVKTFQGNRKKLVVYLYKIN